MIAYLAFLNVCLMMAFGLFGQWHTAVVLLSVQVVLLLVGAIQSRRES